MSVSTSAGVPDPPAIEAGPPGPKRPVVRRRALSALLPMLVAVVVAAGYLVIREPSGTPAVGRWAGAPTATEVPASPSTRPAATLDRTNDPFHAVPSDLHGPPTRLRVGAIGVDTPLETLRLGPDGELRPPETNERAGWYADGTAPGDVGPAVLAGHVDSKRGPAVFYRLREITAGDTIEVTRGGRTVTFTVTSTAWYPKKAFPTDEVYGPTPDRQLRLITCGGVFDRTLRSYRDNLVVYAVAG